MTSHPAPLRVAIVNDYELVTAGVAALLSAHTPPSQVVELDSRVPPVSEVDIVLIDTFAFVSGGLIEVSELARHVDPGGAKVVVYSWVGDPESARRALSDGASGYLWKGLRAAELTAALEAIRAGEVVVRLADTTATTADTATAVEEVAHGPAHSAWPGRHLGLSAREAEVVALIAKGLNNDDIARELYLGMNTIKTYIRGAYRKMGVSSRTQAVLWALDNGFDLHPARTVLTADGAHRPVRGQHDPGRAEAAGAELARRATLISELVPQMSGLSLTSHRDAVPFTVTATSDAVAVLDAVQYLSGGPCVAVAQLGQVVACNRDQLDGQPAWRPFAAATAVAGVSSTLTLPVAHAGRVVGTINLYAGSDDAFTDHHHAIAAAFRDWAPRAIAEARLPERRIKVENKPQRLGDDQDIRSATGKLARDAAVDPQLARSQLDDAAHRAGITKAQLASTILEMDAR